MLLKDLTKVYISRAEEINDHGEYTKEWKFVSIAYLNLQQDLNELDRKASGEVDYEIIKARTEKSYAIEKGDGISLTNISKQEKIIPEYRVTEINKIGSTCLCRMELYNGD